MRLKFVELIDADQAALDSILLTSLVDAVERRELAVVQCDDRLSADFVSNAILIAESLELLLAIATGFALSEPGL